MTSGRRVVVACACVVAAMPGCAGDDDAGDTLPPLPISVVTVAPTTGPNTLTSSTDASDVVTSSSAPSVTGTAFVGDWDGAAFDAGVIGDVGEVGGFGTIEFDRYSFRDPELGTVDAAGFVEEPIAYGWRESPFVNIQPQLRTFVLADEVEVLLLSSEVAVEACRDLETPPRAVWVPVDVSYLDQRAAMEDIATLTYSDDGLVTRIRFTKGCDE